MSLYAHATFLDIGDASSSTASVPDASAFPRHLFSVPLQFGRLITMLIISLLNHVACSLVPYLLQPSDLSYSRVLLYRALAGFHGWDLHPFNNFDEFLTCVSPHLGLTLDATQSDFCSRQSALGHLPSAFHRQTSECRIPQSDSDILNSFFSLYYL